MNILKAAAVSGLTTCVVYFALALWSFLEEKESISELFTVLRALIPFSWGLGSIMSFLLLIPLEPLKRITPPAFSLALFIATGFFLPAIVSLEFSSTSFHGNPPAITQGNAWEASVQIWSNGLIGVATAITAWLCLGKEKRKNEVCDQG